VWKLQSRWGRPFCKDQWLRADQFRCRSPNKKTAWQHKPRAVIQQKQMRSIILLIVFFSTFGCQHDKQLSPEIIGEWESVKFEGSDVGDHISKMEFSFNSDSTFHAIAFMFDSTNNGRSGDFHIKSDSLTMIGNGEAITGKFHFSDDTLIIHDPLIDSRVFLLQTNKR